MAAILLLSIFLINTALATSQQQKMSLNFAEVDIRQVLQSLADIAKVNLVLSESVQGKISIQVENITCQQAFDLILKSYHLEKQIFENTIFISSTTEIMTTQERLLQLKKKLNDLMPLKIALITLKYAKAQDVMQSIKQSGNGLLSSRGKIVVDDRTNSLVIQDLGANLGALQTVIHHLDRAVRQIAIEARIVNVDRNFNKELGARLGLSHQSLGLSGTLEGAHQQIGANDNLNERLNVNLPQTLEGVLGSGQIAVAMAKVGAGVLLDMELSAMESKGKVEIISNPHLLTADQQAATIEAGEEIPYQETSASGATSVSFKKAVLRLQVTPQITPDKQILLKLVVNQDKRSSKPEVLGVPAIDTRHLETQVLISNGDTIVLGGIFERAKNDSEKRVPFFARIPLLGHLFQNQATQNQQTELLIFVTPTIIE